MYNRFLVLLLAGAYIGSHTWMGDDGRDQDAIQAFTGLLNIHLMKPQTDVYADFERQVKQRGREEPFHYEMPEEEEVGALGYIHAVLLLFFFWYSCTFSGVSWKEPTWRVYLLCRAIARSTSGNEAG